MKVVLDLFPLGSVQHGTISRTGVHRVVEQMMLGLAASGEGDLYFHSPKDFWHSHRYFEAHLRGPRTHWAPAPVWLPLARHLAALQAWITQTLRNRAWTLRILRRAVMLYVWAWEPVMARAGRRRLADVDIYHSPFLPLPAWVRAHPSVRRFVTVYDLIPLTNPEFFAADRDIPVLVRRVVDPLGPDDWVLCISHATRAALLEFNPRLDAAKVRVTHLAAAPCFFPERDATRIATVRSRYGVPAGGNYFLSVCTLEPRKNVESVVRAFSRLRRRGAIPGTTSLVLVGNVGWRTEEIFRALEESADLRDSVVATGYVADEDLAALYSGALAFVYPSRAEGFGLPPLEAMQCGTPVITSNVSSLPEVVGDAGLLVAPDDLDGLAAAMLSLHEDAGRRAELITRGLARAREFSWERFTAETFAAYRAAMGPHPA